MRRERPSPWGPMRVVDAHVHFFSHKFFSTLVSQKPGLTLDAVFKAALSVAGPSRLLFGTDSSFFPRGWQRGVFEQQQKALESAGGTSGDAALIFGGNFDRLFPQR